MMRTPISLTFQTLRRLVIFSGPWKLTSHVFPVGLSFGRNHESYYNPFLMALLNMGWCTTLVTSYIFDLSRIVACWKSPRLWRSRVSLMILQCLSAFLVDMMILPQNRNWQRNIQDCWPLMRWKFSISCMHDIVISILFISVDCIYASR